MSGVLDEPIVLLCSNATPVQVVGRGDGGSQPHDYCNAVQDNRRVTRSMARVAQVVAPVGTCSNVAAESICPNLATSACGVVNTKLGDQTGNSSDVRVMDNNEDTPNRRVRRNIRSRVPAQAGASHGVTHSLRPVSPVPLRINIPSVEPKGHSTDVEGSRLSLDLDGTSIGRWSNYELRQLVRWTKVFKDGRGNCQWARIIEAARQETPNLWDRFTRSAIATRYAKLKKAGDVGKYEEITFDSSELGGLPPHNLVESELEGVASIPQAVQDEKEVDEIKFGVIYEREYVKAISSVERTSVGRISRQFNPIFLEWGHGLVSKKLVPNAPMRDRLLVVTAGLYAVAKTVKSITSGVPKAIRMDRTTRIERSVMRMKRIRKEMSHCTQELARRRSGREPTPLQARIIHALRKANLADPAQMEAGLLNRAILLKKISKDVEVRKAELERRKVRSGPIGTVSKPQNGFEKPVIQADAFLKFWTPKTGETQPFVEGDELKVWRASLPAPKPSVFDLNEEWEKVLRKAKNWKAPGPDGVQGFWWKNVKIGRDTLLEVFTEVLNGNGPIPFGSWFCSGRIVSLFKKGDPKNPANYRPIACLNLSRKLLDGLMAEKNRLRFEEVLPEQQNALRRGRWGCSHSLLIDSAIACDVRNDPRKKRAVHIGWIDYEKAFDSIPQEGILYAMRAAGFDRRTIEIYSALMKRSKVVFEVGNGRDKSVSEAMPVKCGVLQGDTFSPMLFCLAIAPVSDYLLRNVRGYYLRASIQPRRIGHLFYVDDLKIYTDSRGELEKAFDGVARVSGYLGLKLNLSKCATSYLQAGSTFKDMSTGDTVVSGVPCLGMRATYKYLGIEQGPGSHPRVSFERLQKSVLLEISEVWSSLLTFRQKVTETNVRIMARLRYMYLSGFTGEGWYSSARDQCKEMDILIANELVNANAKYAKSSRKRMYLPSSEGGYGLVSTLVVFEESIVYAFCYLRLTDGLEDEYESIKRWAVGRNRRTVLSDMRSLLAGYKSVSIADCIPDREKRTPLNLMVLSDNVASHLQFSDATKAARMIVRKLRDERNHALKETWLSNETQSRVIRCRDLDLSDSFRWISQGLVNSRLVGTILAVQENQTFTRTHPGNKDPTSRCRHCNDPHETPVHVVSGCKKFRTTIMVSRHDAVARGLHYSLCLKYGLVPPGYRQRIKASMSNDAVMITWNHKFDDAGFRSNKPDIVVVDKVGKTVSIIDVSVCWYSRIPDVERLKIAKYGVNGTIKANNPALLPFANGPNLAHELGTFYESSATVVPVVIGTCGEAGPGLRESLVALKLEHIDLLIPRLARSAAIGTHWILRAHLGQRGTYGVKD